MKRNPYNFPWSECEFDGNLWKSGVKVKVTQESMENGYQFQKEFMSKVIANKHLTLDTIYTIDVLCVFSDHSQLTLVELPGVVFNSVQFEYVSN